MASKKSKQTGKKKPRTKNTTKHASIEKEDDEKADTHTVTASTPVVGIGASAGGLEAFSCMLNALPTDTGMTYVFVQHLHPDYKSELRSILSRETDMPVIEIHEGLQPRPNHIYVVPANTRIEMLFGKLHLTILPGNEERRATIDHFFRSLAEDQGSKAIGVVLSGTASDGVLGLKAVKEQGGITMAQDEQSAKYNGMPHSAIAAGVVDFVLPPDKIASELKRIARHPYVIGGKRFRSDKETAASKDFLNQIFVLLRRQTGHDFTYYKQTTIKRRIKRRMVLHKLTDEKDYIQLLSKNPAELDDLFHDILINVTGFFRDPDAFQKLREKVFPVLIHASPEYHIRVWVPGCSTGEETYSLAMAWLDYVGETVSTHVMQIFATDIDKLAIEKARAGIYQEPAIQELPSDLLRRYFSKVEGGYQISKTVRDMCIFAEQNVIKDPPFSKLDLISCRNLLIYMEPVLQKRILNTFHYALNPERFLFLGSAESIGEYAKLYKPIEAKSRIFLKKTQSTPQHLNLSLGYSDTPFATLPPADTQHADIQHFNIQRETDRILMSKFVPPALVINDQYDILQFRGHTGFFLEPSPGEASLNLLRMTRDDLIVDVNETVKKAIKTNNPSSKQGIELHRNGEKYIVGIEVLPVKPPTEAARHFLIIFYPPTPSNEKTVNVATSTVVPMVKDASEAQRLEQELAATKEYLQSIIEQQETSNEDLRSAYEEIQSSNEELQSINEELETAKEELQSTNEELTTINDELEARNTELRTTNDDLNNLIASVNIPFIIVGQDLRLRRFTPKVHNLFNLIASDIGRPIGDIKPKLDIPAFLATIQEVINSMRSRKLEVQDENGHWYSIVIRPYKTMDRKIDGAVIAFIDINKLKRSLEEAREARTYAEAIIQSIRHPLLVLDKNLRVHSANDAYLSFFQVSEKETIGNLIYHLGNGQWGIPELRSKLDTVITQGGGFDDFVVSHNHEKIGEKTLSISGRRLATIGNSTPMVVMQVEEMSNNSQPVDEK